MCKLLGFFDSVCAMSKDLPRFCAEQRFALETKRIEELRKKRKAMGKGEGAKKRHGWLQRC
jgi:hypothetical protein